MVAYHHWAGDQLFAAASALSARDLDLAWGGSFGTGRALLRHIVGAERLWCDRLNGRPSSKIPEYPATHAGTDFRDEWTRLTAEERDIVARLTQKALGEELTYVNIKGETKTYVLDDILMHIVNHGTYHRGQISQLLRDRGHASPSTDLLFFFEHEKSR